MKYPTKEKEKREEKFVMELCREYEKAESFEEFSIKSNLMGYHPPKFLNVFWWYYKTQDKGSNSIMWMYLILPIMLLHLIGIPLTFVIFGLKVGLWSMLSLVSGTLLCLFLCVSYHISVENVERAIRTSRSHGTERW